MTLSDRDRKIVMFVIPFVVLIAYWFLLLAPQRKEAQSLGDQVATAQIGRDQAVSIATEAANSKGDFKADYAALLTLGKAIPSQVDMPSLLVQLDRAAAGTDIKFNSVRAGVRQEADAAALSTTTSTPAGDAAPGGTPASSAPGAAAEQAGEAVQTSDQASAAAGADPTAAPSAAPALDRVPLEFTFDGSFFRLADFFHDLKRFVRVNGKGVDVHGRLMTIDSLILKPTNFPRIEAQVVATVYLSPKSQGVAAGAAPGGPAAAPAGAQPAASDPSASPTPTATATIK